MNRTSKRVCLTVDVEQDCPPYLDTWKGIEKGLPSLLALMAEENVWGTFFVTGMAARKYFNAVEAICAAGHELGCHGNTHSDFRSLSLTQTRRELESSTDILGSFGPVRAFRAPYLEFPQARLSLLPEYGIAIDSSLGKYKPAHWMVLTHPLNVQGVRRVPVSLTSSMLRIPSGTSQWLIELCSNPIVLFVHPWEFVDWRRSNLRWDCRFNTGQIALDRFRRVIRYLKASNSIFLPISAV